MNVEQYAEKILGVTNIDFMGDDMPIESNCGDACKSMIDSAKALIDQMNDGNKDFYDCPARYAVVGHVYEGFREDFDFMKKLHDQPDENEIIRIVVAVCQVYIFG